MNDVGLDARRDYLLCGVNGEVHEVRGSDVFLPLTTWLRERLGLTGTKIVCAEGDCGACCVLLGKLAAGGLEYRSVCGCIQSMFQMDLKHVVTIEGLGTVESLNPIQAAMVAHHGAQCGFCTPGMVVALYGLYCQQPDAGPTEIRRGLVGNLCRCTGYEPIIRAAEAVEGRSIPPISTRFDSTALIGRFRRHVAESVEIRHAGRSLYKPCSVNEAANYRARHPHATVVAGGTDLGVLANKGKLDFQQVLVIGDLEELFEIREEPGSLIIGGGVTLSDLENATKTLLPSYARMLGWFGSPPIKHAGTLGGNIANASPIGDTLPGLMVLDAELELQGPDRTRWVRLNDFQTGYRKTVMQLDEILVRVKIPLPKVNEHFRVYKVSKRKDLDISTFTAAFWIRLEEQRIADVRVAFGGVGPNILRLPRTERFLRGRQWSREACEEAGHQGIAEIAPISDVRGSLEYRRLLAEQIWLKWFDELSTDLEALPCPA